MTTLFSDSPDGRLGGTVERVTFHSEETGFCVLRIKVRGRRELATVVGKAASVAPGEYVECEGEWVNDRSHGLQFQARELRIVPPSTREGIEKYLASGMVQGVGPHFAKALVRAFGDDVFDVIEHEPERLRELDGIGPKRQARIVEAWAEQRAVRGIMVFLQSHGVGTARAVRIYRTYGEDAVDLVRENPYRLAFDVHGIGFRSADTIAESLGIPRDSPVRARAGVRHALREIAGEGHCAAPRENLVSSCARMLEVDEALVEDAIDAEIAGDNLVAEPINGIPCLFLTPLHRAEAGVAGHLRRLMDGTSPWAGIDTAKAIPWVEQRTGLVLSPSQRDAVSLALREKVTVVTGGPGVGKTTLLNSLLRIVVAKRARVSLCAPTGRAAKRLSEATGIEARTIHRLLEFDPRSGGFKRGRERPLATDVVVLDEASMVDVVLMNQLLRAVPGSAALWIVGDVDQIPSVGPGAVLADVIRSGSVPTVRLTEIFRQASASRIIVNAHRINRGEIPADTEDRETADFFTVHADTPEEIAEKLFHVVTGRIPRRFGLDPVREIQVLTPMNRGGLGTRSLNEELQRRLNPGKGPTVERFGSVFAPDDKVIQLVNDYDKEVFNGDIGTVVHVDLADNRVSVEFDRREVWYELHELDEIALAYAITIHKSQGSEYPAVVIPLATQHYTMLERNLLYTGVTRGRSLVVLIGQPRAIAMAVKNRRSARRLTNLEGRLRTPEPLPR
jgi:exodeoxyribonuclease V alpha subunit